MELPRGIRNNNPGNIRLGASWEGLVDQIDGVADPVFCQFSTPQYGIRAINHILNAYQARGIVTVQAIIDTWAPPVENITSAYVADVAQSMGITPDITVGIGQRGALIAAIIMHENGQQPYDNATIEAAMVLE